eukprot:2781769-Pyramimonas_sp.AAC.1
MGGSTQPRTWPTSPRPSAEDLKTAFKRARRSVAGPGAIPCKDWMAPDEFPPALHGFLRHLIAGHCIHESLNDSLFAFLPKGKEPLDPRECIGSPLR